MQMPWVIILLNMSFLKNLSHYHSINKVVNRVGGVLMESTSLMGWVCGNSLGEFGRNFLDLLVLRWVTAPRLVFGMMCGVGSLSLRKVFRSCSTLLA